MNYQEYKSLRKQIEQEYEQELAALDKLWKRIQSMNFPSREPEGGESHNGSFSRNFSAHLRTVVKGLRENFTANDVQQGLIDHGFVDKDNVNRLAITNGLHRLSRSGEVEIVQKGRGRIGATYKIKETKGT